MLYHFTHMSNLAAIAEHGIYSDASVHERRQPFTRVGHPDIKERRRRRRVPLPPGGCVADYVPFYFAPRSPMLYVVQQGGVPGYDGGQDEVVFVVTTTEAVSSAAIPFLFTDCNAVLVHARYSGDLDDLNEFVDWELMESEYWAERKEERMAEFLIYRHVPWAVVIGVATYDSARCKEAEAELRRVGVETFVAARREWFF